MTSYRPFIELAQFWLKEIGLEHKRSQYPSFLSGGQQRRLVLVRALASDPKLLLLDEVTANLDEEGIEKVLEVIEKSEATILIISHEPRCFSEIVQQNYELKNSVLFQY